jgi:hypothetical protein
VIANAEDEDHKDYGGNVSALETNTEMFFSEPCLLTMVPYLKTLP